MMDSSRSLLLTALMISKVIFMECGAMQDRKDLRYSTFLNDSSYVKKKKSISFLPRQFLNHFGHFGLYVEINVEQKNMKQED